MTTPGRGASPRRRVLLGALLVLGLTGLAVAVVLGALSLRDSVAATPDGRAPTVLAEQAAEDQRTDRDALVARIEASVLADARGQVEAGFIDGPIESVDCHPAPDARDSTAVIGILMCNALTDRRDDGSRLSHTYHATAHWTDGTYDWGMAE